MYDICAEAVAADGFGGPCGYGTAVGWEFFHDEVKEDSGGW